MRKELCRIADALERLADHLCPQRPGGGDGNKELAAKVDRLIELVATGGNGHPSGALANSKDFYTTDEAAGETGWSPYSVRQRCNRGVIPAEKHNGIWRIPRDEVERIKRDGLPALAP